jgi:predicted O-linked N-acetylglucosamine transferase (SPINDLY family)
MESGQVANAIESYRAALRIMPQFPLVHSDLLYALHFDSANEPAAIFQEHLDWADRYATPLVGEIKPHRRRQRRERLRIGYVSGDFRAHPVGYFLFSLLSQHDHARFEIHAFSDVKQSDPVTARFRELVDQWHEVAAMSDTQLAQCIREREIDVLVDLSGHVGSVRLLTFARKPAPVQVTWLGYPDTTGLATIDYRLTDAHADPIGLTERYHTEQLVRLPNGFLCFPDLLNLDAAPPEARDPAAPVTFGSFNQAAKMSPQTIALWARILKEAGGDARMLIKTQRAGDEQNRQRLRSAFAEHGIDEHRLDILPRQSNYPEHLRRYAQMDVALDTFPYHGTTTTCEALAMGVPVVSLAGQMHVSRVGVSLLTHFGQPDWIAANEDEYVRIGLNLANDRPRLAALRQELRPRLLASPLCDAARFARDVESAYDAMWQHWEKHGGEAD